MNMIKLDFSNKSYKWAKKKETYNLIEKKLNKLTNLEIWLLTLKFKYLDYNNKNWVYFYNCSGSMVR